MVKVIGFLFIASTNKLSGEAIRDIKSSSPWGDRWHASVGQRRYEGAVKQLRVHHAIIVYLRRRVRPKVVFDRSLVLGVQGVDGRHSRLTTHRVLVVIFASLQRRRQSYVVCLEW